MALAGRQRISAAEALRHAWFLESPPPVPPGLFPTWPSRAEGQHVRRHEPEAPVGGGGALGREAEALAALLAHGGAAAADFQLKFG